MALTSSRKRRIDRGQPRITERDQVVLKWIAEQYAIRKDHLQILLARFGDAPREDAKQVKLSTVNNQLARWRNLGLVVYRTVVQSQPAWIWLTAAGMREFGLEFIVTEPTTYTVQHMYASNQIRLMLEEKRPEGQWRSERYMRPQASVLGGGKDTRIVDAVFRLSDEDIGVEIELSDKGKERLERSLALVAHQYTTVWYFCAVSMVEPVRRAVMALSPEIIHRVKVYNLD